MRETEPAAANCPLCHVALRKRLGELECPQCGFVPQPEAPAQRGAGFAGINPSAAATGGRLSFFDPARYIPPEAEESPGSLYFEKRLCFRIFVIFELLPVFALLIFALLMAMAEMGLFEGFEDMFSDMGGMLGLILVLIGVGLIVWGVQAAIYILLLRWALFGAHALPKWGCMALTGLQMLYSIYACFLMSITGQLAGSTEVPVPGEWRGWAATLILIIAMYQGWLVYILQRDVIQR